MRIGRTKKDKRPDERIINKSRIMLLWNNKKNM